MSLQFKIRSSEYNTTNLTDLASSLYANLIPKGCPLSTKGTISSSQILNLNTTPVQILPPLSSGTYVITDAIIRYNFNSIAYAGTDNIAFTYGTGTTIPNQASVSLRDNSINPFITASSSQMTDLYGNMTFLALSVSTINTQSIYLTYLGNNSYTNGNGTLDYAVYYYIF